MTKQATHYNRVAACLVRALRDGRLGLYRDANAALHEADGHLAAWRRQINDEHRIRARRHLPPGEHPSVEEP